MIWLWLLTAAILVLAVIALIAYQRASDLWGRILVGIAAMILGVLGLVMLGGLIIGS